MCFVCWLAFIIYTIFILCIQEKENPDFGRDLRKSENEYEKKRLQLQLFYGNTLYYYLIYVSW